MILDLRQLFSQGMEKLEFDFPFSLSQVEMGGSHPIPGPIRAAGAIVNRAGIVTCEYWVYYTLDVLCDRCLQPIKREVEQAFSHVLVTELENEEDEGEDFFLVEDQRLDMEQLAADDILLNLPTKNLCDPQCKGLCPICGANLNEGDCGCESRQVDPRLAALQALLDADDE
ncbi:MAG: DUF177 domain-containing protein [Oscillospiraceae bacterium]|nr:DUF177 domain-containing protein [Oscillospiraceae bacterium]